MYSLVISTIGCPFLLDSLASMDYPPDDVIVVLDTIGRRSSTLDKDYPIERLEEDLNAHFPEVRLLYTDPDEPWAVMNQCYNIGWQEALNPFVLFTHDDIEWPDFDFPTALKPVLQRLHVDPYIEGEYVAGLVLPEFEIANGVQVPAYPHGTTGLAQCVSPVSQIVSIDALEEMGGFDEKEGIWYDGQLQAEMRIRDWWFLLLPTPMLRHQSNRTYLANNWGARWAANPIWGNFQDNFQRKYGEEWFREIHSLSPVKPLDDARFALAVP